MADSEESFADAIVRLLRERNPDPGDDPTARTICPSEAARAVSPEGWRDRMDECRTAAIRLAHEGVVEICQKGEPVAPESARGPTRIRLIGDR